MSHHFEIKDMNQVVIVRFCNVSAVYYNSKQKSLAIKIPTGETYYENDEDSAEKQYKKYLAWLEIQHEIETKRTFLIEKSMGLIC